MSRKLILLVLLLVGLGDPPRSVYAWAKIVNRRASRQAEAACLREHRERCLAWGGAEFFDHDGMPCGITG